MLVPDVPELPTQVIDVRDLVTWLVDSARDGLRWIFNVTGEAVSFARQLHAARTIAGHVGPVVAAAQEWLLARNVEPWMGDRSLPLWLPPNYAGFNARDSSAARAAGLVTRPLEQTLADTLA